LSVRAQRCQSYYFSATPRMYVCMYMYICMYVQGADKSLSPPGRKQATSTEEFAFHISYL